MKFSLTSLIRKSSKSAAQLHKNQKGASLVEMAIISPIFVTFIFGIFDIGRALDNYAVLTQVVHEGVRFGQGLSELTTGATPTTFCGVPQPDKSYLPCSGATPPAVPVAGGTDRQILDRVNQLVRAHIRNRDLEINPADIQIKTELRPATIAGVTRDTLFVSVQARYNGIFPVYRDIPMTIEATGPYLVG